MKQLFSNQFIESFSANDPADTLEFFMSRKGKPMEMIPVESTNIAAIGYDDETQVLRVQFKRGGSAYEYPNIQRERFDALRTAPSVGGYFSAFIKNLPCKKVEE